MVYPTSGIDGKRWDKVGKGGKRLEKVGIDSGFIGECEFSCVAINSFREEIVLRGYLLSCSALCTHAQGVYCQLGKVKAIFHAYF